MKDSDSKDGSDPWWNAVEELGNRLLTEAVSFTRGYPPEPHERSILIRQAFAWADGMIAERLAE
jgi:hypothetical protein